MADTLAQILFAPDIYPQVIADCYTLIDQELAEKSGVSGAAVKLGYKTVNSFAPGYMRKTLEDMLPQLADKLQPYWEDFGASGGSEFGDFLAKRGDEVPEALLSVTDGMAAVSGRPTIIKAYRAVRGGAVKHVGAALPRLGALVQKYAG